MKSYFKTSWYIYKYLVLLYTAAYWIYFVYDDFHRIVQAFGNLSALGPLLKVWSAYYFFYLIFFSIVCFALLVIGFIIYLLAAHTKSGDHNS